MRDRAILSGRSASNLEPGCAMHERLRPSLSRRRVIALLALAAPAAWMMGRTAVAASVKPLRFVVPNAAGGSSDVLARIVGTRLAEALGRPVVVDLKPGAGGLIAMGAVARAAPDGHTLLLANNGTHATASTSAEGDSPWPGAFAPVTRLTTVSIVIAATPALGVDTLDDLIALARRTPARLPYASGGAGSTSRMAASLLSRRAGIALMPVPYSGTAMAVKDVLSGEVPLIFTQLATVAPLLRNGQLRALAVTSARRVDAFPAIPTIAESGFPEFDVTTWHGLLVPARTPASIVARLHHEVVRILALPDVRDQLASLGMDAVGNSPARFAAEIRAEIEYWATVGTETRP
jgi:tripartite-type tricarboxylate transporter receptor subunit TctC